MPIITDIESEVVFPVKTFIRELQSQRLYDGRLTISDYHFLFSINFGLPFTLWEEQFYSQDIESHDHNFELLIHRKEGFARLDNQERLLFALLISKGVKTLCEQIQQGSFGDIQNQHAGKEIVYCTYIKNSIRAPKRLWAILDDPKFDCTLFLL